MIIGRTNTQRIHAPWRYVQSQMLETPFSKQTDLRSFGTRVSYSFGLIWKGFLIPFLTKKEKIPCQMIQIASVLDKKCDTPVHWLILNKLIYALLEHMFHIVSVSFGSDS